MYKSGVECVKIQDLASKCERLHIHALTLLRKVSALRGGKSHTPVHRMGIFLNLGTKCVFTCCYDLTQHKYVEKSIGLPPFEAGQRGRPRGAHGLGFRPKRGSRASESHQNFGVALRYVYKCGRTLKDAKASSQVCPCSQPCAVT